MRQKGDGKSKAPSNQLLSFLSQPVARSSYLVSEAGERSLLTHTQWRSVKWHLSVGYGICCQLVCCRWYSIVGSSERRTHTHHIYAHTEAWFQDNHPVSPDFPTVIKKTFGVGLLDAYCSVNLRQPSWRRNHETDGLRKYNEGLRIQVRFYLTHEM